MIPDLAVDSAFAHYRIRARLGSGGMGDVYVADDVHLQRPVALKVIRSTEGEGLERVLREARAASAFNHPNVAHIYEVGQLDGIPYISMEYVEGTTLEKRLEAGPLQPAEAIPLAIQISDALSEAANRGVIHRDLKPGNIVINRRGQAKILDFGIARVQRENESPRKETSPNVLAGTIPYMSPEQVRGMRLDARSDIFSFGIILHEMLTGVRPFDGHVALETLQNIASANRGAVGGEEVPPALRRIIDRCLMQDPASRYQSAAEIVGDLETVARDERTSAGERRAGWTGPAVAAAAVVGIAIVAGILMIYRSPVPAAAEAPRLTKLTSAAGLEDEPVFAPDGRRVAYTSDAEGNLDLYVKPLGRGEGVRLTDDPADDAQPAWSPDGRRIAFVSARRRGGRISIVLGQALGNFVNARGGDLFITDAAGGRVEKVADDGFYPSWSHDGKWIVFQSGRGGQWDLWKTPSSGGKAVQITRDPSFDYQPSFSPDGRWIVYGSGMPRPYSVMVVRSEGGTPRALTDGRDGVLLKPVFSADGRSVIYSSARGGALNLWQLPLDKSMRPAGAPRRLTLGTGDDVNASVAADGRRIAYASVTQTPDLWSLDLATGSSRQVTFDTGSEEFPHRSPLGKIAFASDRGGRNALWVLDEHGAMTEVVPNSNAGQPRWSPDGRKLAWRFSERGVTVVGVRSFDPAGQRIIARNAEAPAWSPDGTLLAFTSWDGRAKAQICVAPSDGSGKPRQVTSLDLTTSYPTWSPDGQSVAFQATRDDGTRHIWIADLISGRTRPVTSGSSEDSHPQWLPTDADRIVFVRNHENLMVVSVSTGKVHPLTRHAEPNMVLDYPGCSPDGRRVDFSIARKRGDLYLLEKE